MGENRRQTAIWFMVPGEKPYYKLILNGKVQKGKGQQSLHGPGM